MTPLQERALVAIAELRALVRDEVSPEELAERDPVMYVTLLHVLLRWGTPRNRAVEDVLDELEMDLLMCEVLT